MTWTMEWWYKVMILVRKSDVTKVGILFGLPKHFPKKIKMF